MTKEEALKILEEATARLQLVRQDHVTIVRALDVIKEKLEIK
jgi:hypothetical protein